MTYISSGQFRTDIENALGKPLTQREEPELDDDDDDEEDALAAVPKKLRTELVAVRDLWSNWDVPNLAGLEWGNYCSVPDLNGYDYDEVLEDWFPGDKATTKLVMSAIAIFHGGGGYYVVVNTDGKMGVVTEDPYGFQPIECTLQAFLEALVAAHDAACTRGLPAAHEELDKAVGKTSTTKLLLTFAKRVVPSKSKSK